MYSRFVRGNTLEDFKQSEEYKTPLPFLILVETPYNETFIALSKVPQLRPLQGIVVLTLMYICGTEGQETVEMLDWDPKMTSYLIQHYLAKEGQYGVLLSSLELITHRYLRSINNALA